MLSDAKDAKTSSWIPGSIVNQLRAKGLFVCLRHCSVLICGPTHSAWSIGVFSKYLS